MLCVIFQKPWLKWSTHGKVVGPESADDLTCLSDVDLSAAPGGDEATVESDDEFEEFAEFASDFSGPRTQGVFTCRKELRCNKSLENALPRIINFGESDLACRRLAARRCTHAPVLARAGARTRRASQ